MWLEVASLKFYGTMNICEPLNKSHSLPKREHGIALIDFDEPTAAVDNQIRCDFFSVRQNRLPFIGFLKLSFQL